MANRSRIRSPKWAAHRFDGQKGSNWITKWAVHWFHCWNSVRTGRIGSPKGRYKCFIAGTGRRYRLLWIVLGLGAGTLVCTLSHLLFFHIYIIHRRMSTYDYILEKRANNKQQAREGSLWTRNSKIVPLNAAAPAVGTDCRDSHDALPHDPHLSTALP
jgi:hypothetical protein